MKPPIVQARPPRVSEERRFELCRRGREGACGGVYDLDVRVQETLVMKSGAFATSFLPDFVIVLWVFDESEAGPDEDLRVHVGGSVWNFEQKTTRLDGRRNEDARDYRGVRELLLGTYRNDPAPAWLLDLIRDHTPWGHLLDDARYL